MLQHGGSVLLPAPLRPWHPLGSPAATGRQPHPHEVPGGSLAANHVADWYSQIPTSKGKEKKLKKPFSSTETQATTGEAGN